ncbi:phospholipase domain-containing protein [Candidatus Burkholderia verschuerenii]|nr:phospholipase domain-containing protein [Candidatus Burkholderia verschuerenii]
MSSAGEITAAQRVTVCYEITQGNLALNLSNDGSASSTFIITDNRYGMSPQTVTVAAGQTVQTGWDLGFSKRWYDISVTLADDAHYLRQFAGYVETGAAGVTDPSMA